MLRKLTKRFPSWSPGRWQWSGPWRAALPGWSIRRVKPHWTNCPSALATWSRRSVSSSGRGWKLAVTWPPPFSTQIRRPAGIWCPSRIWKKFPMRWKPARTQPRLWQKPRRLWIRPSPSLRPRTSLRFCLAFFPQVAVINWILQLIFWIPCQRLYSQTEASSQRAARKESWAGTSPQICLCLTHLLIKGTI